MTSKWWMWVLVSVLLVPLAACSGVSATVHFRADETYNYVTIEMTEQEAQTLFTGIFAESDDLPISNPVVDLRPGEIAITGDVPSGNGGTVQANLIVQAEMVSGQPSLQVTSFNFAGWEGTPDMLAEINGNIASGFAEAAANADEGQLTEISITDTGLSFTVRGLRENE